MKVSIRLFAILRERAGVDRVELELPDRATVADAIAAAAALPGLAALSQGSARMAVNREYAEPDAVIAADDELALIPPVSGGSGEPTEPPAGVHARVGAEPLSLDELIDTVADPAAGAIVTFQGLPRDVPALDYEAYPEMALARIEQILADCRERHGLCAAAAAHRVGEVPAGQASIIVAASAPHRGEAFTGAREILDRIKAEAPIWKVELDAAGERHRPAGVLPGVSGRAGAL